MQSRGGLLRAPAERKWKPNVSAAGYYVVLLTFVLTCRLRVHFRPKQFSFVGPITCDAPAGHLSGGFPYWGQTRGARFVQASASDRIIASYSRTIDPNGILVSLYRSIKDN